MSTEGAVISTALHLLVMVVLEDLLSGTSDLIYLRRLPGPSQGGFSGVTFSSLS